MSVRLVDEAFKPDPPKIDFPSLGRLEDSLDGDTLAGYVVSYVGSKGGVRVLWNGFNTLTNLGLLHNTADLILSTSRKST